jgi:hypothetical protein
VPEATRPHESTGDAYGDKPRVTSAGEFAGVFGRAGLNPGDAGRGLPSRQFRRADYVTGRGAFWRGRGFMRHKSSVEIVREFRARDASGGGSNRAAWWFPPGEVWTDCKRAGIFL